MDALLRAKERANLTLRNNIREMDRRNREETAWLKAQLRQKDDNLCCLRKSLAYSEKQRRAAKREEDRWGRERVEMEERVKTAVEWGTTIFSQKEEVTSVLHQTLQMLQDKEKNLKALREFLHTATTERERMATTIRETEVWAAAMRREHERIFNSHLVSLDKLEQERHQEKERLEAQALLISNLRRTLQREERKKEKIESVAQALMVSNLRQTLQKKARRNEKMESEAQALLISNLRQTVQMEREQAANVLEDKDKECNALVKSLETMITEREAMAAAVSAALGAQSAAQKVCEKEKAAMWVTIKETEVRATVTRREQEKTFNSHLVALGELERERRQEKERLEAQVLLQKQEWKKAKLELENQFSLQNENRRIQKMESEAQAHLIANLRQTLEKEQEQAAKALQDREKELHTLYKSLQTLTTTAAICQKETEAMWVAIKEAEVGAVATRRENEKTFNSHLVALGKLERERHEQTLEKKRLEAHILLQNEELSKEKKDLEDKFLLESSLWDNEKAAMEEAIKDLEEKALRDPKKPPKSKFRKVLDHLNPFKKEKTRRN